MGNHDNEGGRRKKKSDKAKITRQRNGPYSTRSARINLVVSSARTGYTPGESVSPERKR